MNNLTLIYFLLSLYCKQIFSLFSEVVGKLTFIDNTKKTKNRLMPQKYCSCCCIHDVNGLSFSSDNHLVAGEVFQMKLEKLAKTKRK